MRYFVLVSTFLTITSICAYSQSIFDNLHLHAQVGARTDFPMGGIVSDLNEILNEVTAVSGIGASSGVYSINGVGIDSEQRLEIIGGRTDGYSWKIKTLPYPTYQLGVRVGFEQNVNTILGSGIQFSKRGSWVGYTFAYNDPEFQYDNIETGSFRVGVSTVEIPLWMLHQINADWQLGVELGINFQRQSSTKATEIYRRQLIINGEEQPVVNADKVKYKSEPTAFYQSVAPSAGLQLRRQIGYNLDLGIGVAVNGWVAKMGDRSLWTTTTSLLLNYRIW